MVQKGYLKVPLKEAIKISVTCGRCKTDVVLTVDGDPKQRQRIQDEMNKVCPGCGVAFQKSFSSALTHFVHWYELALESGHEIHLVIDQ